jgi:hypothetical protein
LPGEANITTAAGDVAVFQSTGSNTVQCISYTKADGTGIVAAGGGSVTNLLINGSFDIDTRLGGFTAAHADFPNNDDSYLLDQWILLSDGDDIVDVAKVTTSQLTGLKNAGRMEVATADKKFGFLQILESRHAEKIIGSTCSLSFSAKVTSAAAGRLDNIKAAVLSWDSTADSVTSDVISNWAAEDTTPTLVANWTFENTPANLGVTTSSARYTIEGISIDTAATNNVAVFIWADGFTGTVTDQLHISGVQLEEGATASDPEPTDATIERIRCSRYAQRFDQSGTRTLGYAGRASNTTNVIFFMPLQAPFRATPSITLNSAGLDINAYDDAGAHGISSISITTISHGINYSNMLTATSVNHTGTLTAPSGVTLEIQSESIWFFAEL